MERESLAPHEVASPFLKVEVDGEHKYFTKQCTACGQEFRTAVPRKFFRNPDDESTQLAANGSGTIDGYDSIRSADVERNIFASTCADTQRNAKAEHPV